jgi:hypothetical protein
LFSALPVIPPGLPIYQDDSIRVTVTQLVVTSDNSRVAMTATIDNTTAAPLYFALQNGNFSIGPTICPRINKGK